MSGCLHEDREPVGGTSPEWMCTTCFARLPGPPCPDCEVVEITTVAGVVATTYIAPCRAHRPREVVS